tara:strand:+ start:162 stop:746 length:585 start_codon:yes stop_codon:yes gene_type:complete
MNTEKSIVSEIFEDIFFSQEEIDFICAKFLKVTYTKGDVLIAPNTDVIHQFYVFNGCLRAFFNDKSGKEHTVQFAIKSWWITDYASYFNLEKSMLTIECIKDSVVFKISKEDLEEIYILYPKVHFFVRKKLERGYASSFIRILKNLSQTATERYLQFIDKYPDIEKNVKNYHIASYLGITTESLSRIRKKNQKN